MAAKKLKLEWGNAEAPQTSATDAPQLVRIDLIDASPENPRKEFEQKALDELAADIKTHGVLQAVGLRRTGERFELIWGERRWRASKLAGLEEIPARVLNVDDETAEVMRFSENKHESLSALELAGGYQRLVERYRYTVVQLAAKVKRSDASVRDTLALNKLGSVARRAFSEGALNASTGLLISQLPPVVQPSVVMEATSGEEPMSFRELKGHIAKEWVLDLGAARFPPLDAALVPDVGACPSCPWNDGSCRNLPCYRKKEEAWLERQRKAGRRVLTSEESAQAFPYGDDRPSFDEGYVLADDVDGYAADDDETWRDKLGADAQKHLVLARTPRGALVEVLPTSVLPKRKRAEEPQPANDDEPDERAADRRRAKEERERSLRREVARAVVVALAGRLRVTKPKALVDAAVQLGQPLIDAAARADYPPALREACELLGVNFGVIENAMRARLKKEAA